MYLPGGVPALGSTCLGEYLPVGVPAKRGVPAWGGLPAQGVPAWGVYLLGVYLPRGGVPAQGGVCIPACTEADTPNPCKQND